MTSTDDLRRTVAAHSESALGDVDIEGLVAGAARRGRRRRAVRTAASTVALGAVAAAAITLVPTLLPSDPQPVRQPIEETLGFPAVMDGGFLRAADSGTGEVSVTTTAGTTGMGWAVTCSSPTGRPVDLVVEISIGNTRDPLFAAGGPCTPGGPPSMQSTGGWDTDSWRDYGVEPGDPVTFTATQQHGKGATVQTGVYDLVPLAQYPLLPAPDPLPPLAPPGSVTIDATGDDVEPLLDTSFAWDDQGRYSQEFEIEVPNGAVDVPVMVWSQTPAEVRISVDGREQHHATFYDYSQSPHYLQSLDTAGSAPGTTATVRFDVESPTGRGAIGVLMVAEQPGMVFNSAPGPVETP